MKSLTSALVVGSVLDTEVKRRFAGATLIDSTPASTPAKPELSFCETLRLVLTASIFHPTEEKLRTLKSKKGSAPCATCYQLVSANKVQCFACSEMSELLLLILSRTPGDPTVASVAAEERILELKIKFHTKAMFLKLIAFAGTMVASKNPDVSFETAAENVTGLLA